MCDCTAKMQVRTARTLLTTAADDSELIGALRRHRLDQLHAFARIKTADIAHRKRRTSGLLRRKRAAVIVRAVVRDNDAALQVRKVLGDVAAKRLGDHNHAS